MRGWPICQVHYLEVLALNIPQVLLSVPGCEVPGGSGFRLFLLNVRLIPNKAALLHDVLCHVSLKPGCAQRRGSPFSVGNVPTPISGFAPGEIPGERRGGCCHRWFAKGSWLVHLVLCFISGWLQEHFPSLVKHCVNMALTGRKVSPAYFGYK